MNGVIFTLWLVMLFSPREATASQNISANTSSENRSEGASVLLERFESILVTSPGKGYRANKIKSYSHYREAIQLGHDGLQGRSRKWGDADLVVQAIVVDRVVKMCREARFTERETCLAVALCRVEAGLNPDAAAGISSACGLGQFIDDTRATLCSRAGIASDDPFCVELNLVCMREALKEAFTFAGKRAQRGSDRYLVLAYAYHHDGPALDSGGEQIAILKILPWLDKTKQCLRTTTTTR